MVEARHALSADEARAIAARGDGHAAGPFGPRGRLARLREVLG